MYSLNSFLECIRSSIHLKLNFFCHIKNLLCN
nr:MAG TPA: hypothetical protein [Caudoviricetes sp.]